MSTNINSFVGDLVAMAQAMDELPKVQAQLEVSKGENEAFLQMVQDREVAIVNYKREIETLNSLIRSLEVERDDAAFRTLELEDKATQVLGWLGDIKSGTEGIARLLSPLKPEPVIEPVGEAAVSAPEAEPGQSEPLPTQPSGPVDTAPATLIDTGNNAPVTIGAEPTSNASPNTTTETSPYGESLAADTGPDTIDPTNARSLTEADIIPATGKYHGLNYWDLPQFINEDDWVANGGDLNNYLYGKKTPATPIAEMKPIPSDDDMPF